MFCGINLSMPDTETPDERPLTRLEHGAYCVGCCWAWMLLLFAGGVMNLTVIAALSAICGMPDWLSRAAAHRFTSVLLI
jgi:predicted metal-binding membrane protein